jgi:hypothetical protein
MFIVCRFDYTSGCLISSTVCCSVCIDRRLVSLTASAVVDLLQDPGVDFPEMTARAQARLAEIAAQRARVSAYTITGPKAVNMTIANVLAAYQAAGGSAKVVPSADFISGTLNYTYNLATWNGNTTAYMTCNLPVRGPEYEGVCQDMPVTCLVNANTDERPYNCTKPDGSTVPGNVSSSSYREGCELPCDRQLDCSVLCECYDTCGDKQVSHPFSAAMGHGAKCFAKGGVD